MKYQITLQDCFSFAVTKKEVSLTPKQVDRIKMDIIDKRVVHQQFTDNIHWDWIPKRIIPAKVAENKVFIMNYAYFNLTINERINLRQYRNALKINWLFSTCISGYKVGDKQTEYPVNNQIKLYHVYGKGHSQYPKN